MAEITKSDATQKIWMAIDLAKKTAVDADREFDQKSRSIQRKASSSIDLFGGNATTQVADLAVESKIACDTLYAALQMALHILDQTCRPLLAFQPDASAVKEVYDEIKELNCDSTIQNNFTASFNNRNLGDVATRRYTPSIEARMIEQFWHSEFQKVAADYEREEEEKIALIRQEEEEERRRAEAFREKHKKEIEEYNQKAEESVTVLTRLEEENFERKIGDVKNNRNKEIEEVEKKISKELDGKILKVREGRNDMSQDYIERAKSLRSELEDTKATLQKLRKFEFFKKQNEEKKIEALILQLQQENDEFLKKNQKAESEIKNIEEEKRGKLEKQIKTIEAKYPFPEKVEKPKEKTAMKMYNEAVKDAIYDLLQTTGASYTISDIMVECVETMDMTTQRVSALLRQLLSENRIERFYVEREAYFRALESGVKTSAPRNENYIQTMEDMLKEQSISYSQMGGSDLQLEDYEKYGYLKWLAMDKKIYCDFQENDFVIHYIPKEYRM